MQPIGVATTGAQLEWWCAAVARVGWPPRPWRLNDPDVEGGCVAVWLVVIPGDDSPLHVRDWLQQLAAPIVLITPLLALGAQLAPQVPALALICHPSRAAHVLADLAPMALSRTSGCAILGPLDAPLGRPQATPRTPRQLLPRRIHR